MILFQKGQTIDNRYTVVFPHKEGSYAETYRVRDTDGKLRVLKLIYYSKLQFSQFDKDGSIMYSLHWEHYFKHIVEKYNTIYKIQMPKVTPHVCRHTYCSNMAKSGMNPKTLQYLMGHSDIGVTLNVYTHVNFDDAKADLERMKVM